MRPILLMAAMAALALCACGQTETDASEEGFIRLPPPGSTMSAAYLTLTLDNDDRLVRADVEGVRVTEIHRVFEEDGIVKMRPVAALDVQAGEPLVLAPGGTHLMLIGLQDPLEEGGEREVVLTFESGHTLTMVLPVRMERRRRS